jgi:multicomponent K+:H+ antiporter subunit G
MSEGAMAPWAQIAVAALVLAGAALALLGSLGLVRLPTFFERAHAPAVIATGGCWCIVLGMVVFFSVRQGELALFPLLIALFVAITTPVATIFLMRANLFRARQMGKDVPPNLSRSVRTDPGDA